MNNPLLLFKYPSRSRPENFFRGLDNITGFIQTTNYKILCSFDIDDPKMCAPEVKERLSTYEKVHAVYGTSKTKVEAINADIWMIDAWDIMVVMSDDILFTTPAFDQYIIEDFKKYFKSGDGFLHYPEINGGEAQVTMSIMDKSYYDRFSYIYHPSYKSVYCDNEALAVAKILGRHKFVDRKIFQHLHPAFRLPSGEVVPQDELYRRNEEPTSYRADAATFYRRQGLNFDL